MRLGFRKRVRVGRYLTVNLSKTLPPSLTIGRRLRLNINRRGIAFGATLGFGFFLIHQLFNWRKS
jgi:hypothetical protein